MTDTCIRYSAAPAAPALPPVHPPLHGEWLTIAQAIAAGANTRAELGQRLRREGEGLAKAKTRVAAICHRMIERGLMSYGLGEYGLTSEGRAAMARREAA
jgi:hypothetical protein